MLAFCQHVTGFLKLLLSMMSVCNYYHTVKNFGDKKAWQKGCCKGLAKN